MANNLALDRCDLYGIEPAHEENCWQVFNFREEGKPVIKSHIPFREAMALVMDVPLAEIEAMAAAFENETPEEEQAWWDAINADVGDTCFCGNAFKPGSTMCTECIDLLGKREFAIGQKVVIIRNETWKGRICTITLHSHQNPNMYWLKEHGWRRSDEIEPVHIPEKGI